MTSAKLFVMDTILKRPKEELDNLASAMSVMLDQLHAVFLKDQKFLAGVINDYNYMMFLQTKSGMVGL